MHICPLSWALRICKNIGIQTYFGPVTVESVKVFRHFAFWRHGTRLATFLIAPKNCILLRRILLRRIFWAHQKFGNFGPQKFTKISWNPPILLLHPNIYFISRYTSDTSHELQIFHELCICGLGLVYVHWLHIQLHMLRTIDLLLSEGMYQAGYVAWRMGMPHVTNYMLRTTDLLLSEEMYRAGYVAYTSDTIQELQIFHELCICHMWIFHELCICRICGMTHWHASYIRAAWLIRTCGMTRLCVWHDIFACVLHSFV